MLNKFLVTFVTIGGMAAIAGTGSYKVSLMQDSVLNGQQLKAGTYKVDVQNNTATLTKGKAAVQAPAKEEQTPNKFANTQMVYTNNDLREIDIGGTHTKIVFTGSGQVSSGE
jgi:hypothetical protein